MAAAQEVETRSTHIIQDMDQVGQIVIDDEVIAMVAGLAAMEVDGVYSMAGNITKELMAKIGGNSLKKGVKVDVGDKEVTVYLSLNIHFGHNIPDTSAAVQERVKSAIESMIGYTVKSVHIKIAGVIVD